MYKESKTGLWCREGTLDEYVIKEQSSYRAFFSLMKGKTVVDIGSNIGAFAYFSKQNGAKEVICFEPDPENIRVWEKQELEAKLIKRAVSNKSGTAKFYVNNGKNKGMHSLQPIRGRTEIVVKTVDFHEVLKRYAPDLLKIDIEGGEYNLPLSEIPEFVKGIAIEIHLNHGNNRNLGKNLVKQLEQQFPNILHKPNITAKNWTTLFIGTREEDYE